MAKMTKGTFESKTAKGTEKRDGYLFDLLLTDNTVKRMGVYKTDTGNWWVVDLASGLGVVNMPTRKEAVEKVESEQVLAKLTEHFGSEKYAEQVAEAKAEQKPKHDKMAIAKAAETKAPKRKAPKPPTEVKVTKARIDITPEGVKATPIESHVEKVEPVEQALEISLATMSEWCKERGLLAKQATDKNGVPKAGSIVKVFGVGKFDTDVQAELKEMGFRYKRDKDFWWSYPTA